MTQVELVKHVKSHLREGLPIDVQKLLSMDVSEVYNEYLAGLEVQDITESFSLGFLFGAALVYEIAVARSLRERNTFTGSNN